MCAISFLTVAGQVSLWTTGHGQIWPQRKTTVTCVYQYGGTEYSVEEHYVQDKYNTVFQVGSSGSGGTATGLSFLTGWRPCSPVTDCHPAFQVAVPFDPSAPRAVLVFCFYCNSDFVMTS